MYLNCFRIGFNKEIEQCTAEVMCMTIWIAQLIGDGIQKQITSLVIQIDNKILKNVHVRTMYDGGHVWYEIL